MEVELATIGGYEEVGRQMTAIRAGDDVVILDMGLNLSKVLLHDDVMTERMHSLDLIDMGAIPDDRVMSDVHGEVQAIVPTHGHLDHVGAIPKLAHRYDAPIVGTPYTIELVKQQIQDEEKFNVDNDLVEMRAGETMEVGDTGDLDLEFVNVTHSIPDAVNPVLHTPEGAVIYGLDKRIDHNPVIGDPFDMERFREIAENQGVLGYVEDCTNASKTGRTYSESIAREQVRDVIESMADYDGGILATTFSSHIARVSSLVEFAQSIDRTPMLLGRSMNQYSSAAQRLGIADFDGVEMYGYRDEIDQALNKIMQDGKGEYFPIVTGHQGEPRAMMTQIARGETQYELEKGDKVIFSAGIIPEPMNEGQRHQLERLLGLQGARVYSDVHVSGHVRREGLYTMLTTLEPDHVVPAHQSMAGVTAYVNMAEDEGYVVGRDLHPSRNGNIITLSED